MEISKLLKIKKGVTSIIGAGGKTSLMLQLAQELLSKGTVIILTTTRIMPPSNIKLVTTNDITEVRKEVEENKLICVSEGVDENGKLLPPAIKISALLEIADYIICEADGSKRLPLKAHAEHEPVIPDESNQTILVMGIDGIGKHIFEACHRPEIYARLAGVKQDEIVTPEIAAIVANKEQLGTTLYINKVDNDELMAVAIKVSEAINLPTIAGSIRNGEYKCL